MFRCYYCPNLKVWNDYFSSVHIHLSIIHDGPRFDCYFVIFIHVDVFILLSSSFIFGLSLWWERGGGRWVIFNLRNLFFFFKEILDLIIKIVKCVSSSCQERKPLNLKFLFGNVDNRLDTQLNVRLCSSMPNYGECFKQGLEHGNLIKIE